MKIFRTLDSSKSKVPTQVLNDDNNAHLPKAAFAQHLDEVKVFNIILPEARYGARGRREPAGFAEYTIRRRLLW